MRQDYQRFVERGAEVIAVGPDLAEAFRRYWERERLPFVGLSDSRRQVLRLYRQRFNVLKLGRMPSVLVIDREGSVRYRHDGSGMEDIPENNTIFAVLDKIGCRT